MKKSKMIKNIVAVLARHGLTQKRATKKNGQIAKDILQACEEAGMYPPMRHILLEGPNCASTYMECSWEEE